MKKMNAMMLKGVAIWIEEDRERRRRLDEENRLWPKERAERRRREDEEDRLEAKRQDEEDRLWAKERANDVVVKTRKIENAVAVGIVKTKKTVLRF